MAMILYVQVTVSQYYLKSENTVPVILRNSNVNLLTERSWNRSVNRSELMCEVVKMKMVTFMRGDYGFLKMTRCEAITDTDDQNKYQICFEENF